MEKKLANFVALGLNCRQQTKLLKGNVFTPVCHSVHGGRVQPLGPGLTPPGPLPLWQTPPGQTPPPPTAATVDGTHSTGMHSCSI